MDVGKNTGLAAALLLLICASVPSVRSQGSGCPVDVVVCLDGSGSINSTDWATVTVALRNMILSLDISPELVNLALVQYSTSISYSSTDFGSNKQALISEFARANANRFEEGTYTHLAIDTSRNLLRTKGRPNVPKAMVVVTDGDPDQIAATNAAVDAAIRDGILMFAVGYAGIDPAQLLRLVNGQSSRVQRADDAQGLAVALTSFTSTVCVEVEKGTCSSYRGNLILVLDESESARDKATSDNMKANTNRRFYWDILRNQVNDFATSLNGLTQNVKIGIVSYTTFRSNATGLVRGTVIPLVDNQQLSALLSGNDPVIPDKEITKSGSEAGGSQTFKPLNYIVGNNDIRPVAGLENVICVVSAKGSTSGTDETQTLNHGRTLTNLNFQMYSIGVGSDLRTEDLRNVVDNDNTLYTPIASYDELSFTLMNSVVKRFFCTQATPPPTTQAPKPAPPTECDCAVASGKYTYQHNSTCGKFNMCDRKGDAFIVHTFHCGPGTLFNETLGTCTYPKYYECNAWPKCTKDTTREVMAGDFCCNQYWLCEKGNVTLKTCPAGQWFNGDVNVKSCVSTPNSCLDHYYCKMSNDETCPFVVHPSDKCRFKTLAAPAGTEPNGRECNDGFSYNPTTCRCTTPDAACLRKEGINKIDGRADRQACFAARNYDFASGDNQIATNDVTGQKVPAYVNFYQLTKDITVGSSQGDGAIFRGIEYNPLQTNQKNDLIFINDFTNKQLPFTFAMRLEFRFASDANDQEYVLMSNDNCNQCNATYRLYARQAGNGRWTFYFWARVGKNNVLKNMPEEFTISSTSSVSVNPNQWYTLSLRVQENEPSKWFRSFLKYNATVSATIDTAPMTVFSTQFIYNPIENMNGCGLSLGQGVVSDAKDNTTVAFKGAIRRFKFYDCTDVGNLD